MTVFFGLLIYFIAINEIVTDIYSLLGNNVNTTLWTISIRIGTIYWSIYLISYAFQKNVFINNMHEPRTINSLQ